MSEPDKEHSRADRRFGRTVVALVAFGFLCVLAAGIAATLVVRRGQEHARWVQHTYEVERHVTGVRLALEEMRSTRRALLLRLPGSSQAAFLEAGQHLDRETSAIAGLTLDNPKQQGRVAELQRAARKIHQLAQDSAALVSVASIEAEQARLQAGQAVERIIGAMMADERQLLAERTAAQERSVQTFYMILGAAAILLLAVGAVSISVILRNTRDLLHTRDRLRDLNANLEGAVQVRTRDLQRANDEIQRFAYIVSHDLRSPLVNVMGFTSELETAVKPLSALIERVEEEAPEVASREAKLAVQEDLPEAIGFIRTSTQKMDRLINAILRLSREGRRTIAPERTAITGMVQSVADGIRHLIDERGASVEIQPDMPVIVTDRLALEQIVSNIVENALKYLQPGRPGKISVGAREALGRVQIRVSDNGRGIDRKDHERIFDLFRRSGSQDQPGEGIGLAHVRALAYRLGGTISVSSELDRGATFTIDLPVTFTAEKDLVG